MFCLFGDTTRAIKQQQQKQGCCFFPVSCFVLFFVRVDETVIYIFFYISYDAVEAAFH